MTESFRQSMIWAMNDAWTSLTEIIGHSYCVKTSSNEVLNTEIDRAHEIARGVDELLEEKALTDGFLYPTELDDVTAAMMKIDKENSRVVIGSVSGIALGKVDAAIFALIGGAA